jgi:DNA polymerase I-like protein with 3'-5' exonuclease and polymerase domains
MSGDESMINSYMQGKDLYAEIASSVYNMPYEDCLEFYLDGNGNKTGETNKDGKARRSSVKSLLLGFMYGRGVASVAEQIHKSVKEAQELTDTFFHHFPKVDKYIKDVQEHAKEYGFVETAWGRKRRLPNIQLEPYEFDFTNEKQSENFDPLNFDDIGTDYINYFGLYSQIEYYQALLDKAYGRQAKEQVKAKARQEGIIIKDNGGYIADAERQCVNSIIQGTAADITKKAMIKIGNDKQLKEWNCKLVNQVHDEVIVECPIVNAKKCADRVCELMIEAAAEKITVPMKADAEITREWYGESIELREL